VDLRLVLLSVKKKLYTDVTPNQNILSLIESFIHNENIRNNQQSSIFLLQGQTGTGKKVLAR